MPEPQPEDLTAFLATAEYCILHTGEIPEGASESLRSLGTYYGPRLFAAVEAALKHHWPEESGWGKRCGGCWSKGGSHPVWPCTSMVDIVSALLAEGER